jgi:hypothetical protein
MAQKYEALDVMNLFKDWDDSRFSMFVNKMIARRDFKAMVKARYGLQAGMAYISNKSICPEDYVNKFIRWQRIIESGIKIMWRRMYPNPLDNPANKNNPTLDIDACLKHKRERDNNLLQLLKKHSY